MKIVTIPRKGIILINKIRKKLSNNLINYYYVVYYDIYYRLWKFTSNLRYRTYTGVGVLANRNPTQRYRVDATRKLFRVQSEYINNLII